MALRQDGGREQVEPDTLVAGVGRYLSFRSADHWPRTVRFQLDSVAPEGRAFLEGAGAVESPPLVEAGSRWVVELDGAPAGVYPFEVAGSRLPGRGVVVVEGPPAR